MIFENTTRSKPPKIGMVVLLFFLALACFVTLIIPEEPFFWIWSLFFLIGNVIYFYEYFKKHRWIFQVEADYVMFNDIESSKKKFVRIEAVDIADIYLMKRDLISGKVLKNDGVIISIPSACLASFEEIVHELKNIGISTYLVS